MNGLLVHNCHYLKNPRAQRTQEFYALLKALAPKYFIGLTGTPIKNRVPDLWTLFAFCRVNPLNTSGTRLEGDLAHFGRFCKHFCYAEDMFINGARIPRFTGLREERKDELRELLKGKAIRFSLDQVAIDLPELIRVDVPLAFLEESDPGLLKTFQDYMAGHKRDITAKVRSAWLKAPATAEYVEKILEETGGPVLVYSDHVDSAKRLSGRMANDRRTVLITGATPMEERESVVKKFQDGEVDVLVATIGALSVGVTLTRARDVVFNDLSWTPADNLQAEKRIHRIGQKSRCFAHYITSTPTDAYIKKTLAEKLKTIREVIER